MNINHTACISDSFLWVFIGGEDNGGEGVCILTMETCEGKSLCLCPPPSLPPSLPWSMLIPEREALEFTGVLEF